MLKDRLGTKGNWDYGLSARTRHCLCNFGINSLADCVYAYVNNQLRPNPKKTKNFGKKSYKELDIWLGSQGGKSKYMIDRFIQQTGIDLESITKEDLILRVIDWLTD